MGSEMCIRDSQCREEFVQRFSRADNGRVLRHRFSPKATSVATPISLPKRNRAAKEAVSAALQTKMHHRNDRHGKSNESPRTKPRPCVKTMLHDREAVERSPFRNGSGHSGQKFRDGIHFAIAESRNEIADHGYRFGVDGNLVIGILDVLVAQRDCGLLGNIVVRVTNSA